MCMWMAHMYRLRGCYQRPRAAAFLSLAPSIARLGRDFKYFADFAAFLPIFADKGQKNFMTKQKIGLVLEGGGMRGGYTAGVLDAFLDHNIQFPYCVAVSAGACNALSYIAGQRGRYIRANTEYLNDKRYMGFSSLLHTGYLFGNRFVFDQITFDLVPLDCEGFIEGSKSCPLTVVSTECETGRARYDVIDDFYRQMCLIEASSSLPLLSPWVPYGDKHLMDGGCSDSIPVRRALDDGCGKAVVILTQHSGYRKGPNKLLPLLRHRYRAYPEFVRALERRHEVYNETLDFLAREQAAGRVFVIQPKVPVEVGRMERSVPKIYALYDSGIADGNAAADELRRFMEE